jgi:hypothetical protein
MTPEHQTNQSGALPPNIVDALQQQLESVNNAGLCPVHNGYAGRAHAAQRALEPDDELVLPMNKRVVAQYGSNEDGIRELTLYYGDKEISFDEPELFAFGETLARQPRFIAGASVLWSEGQDWMRIQGLLEQLIAEGVLFYADETDGEAAVHGDAGARPSPLGPATASTPRTWFDSRDITAELTGRSIEPGYLELVVPIFRVAHMSMDADGRQVGESNVFPPALRLDIPTRWRTCIYEGTRHQVDRPMNVTALKSMRAHWGQMMAVLLHVRAAYLKRFPEARRGWTVGHLERLSVSVLALPTYLLMRRDNRIENGDLHPALSSLFRVTDGLRMTMHQMLFVPIGEPARSPDTPMTSAEIYAYAERNYSFHSEHGVCAGPKVMIEEFFSVLVDGRMPRGGLPWQLDPQVRDAVADLDPVIDYALLGLQAYAAVFSVWPAMARAYENLWTVADCWAAAGQPAVTALRDHLQASVDRITQSGYLATEERRSDRDAVYADMYAQCETGLTGEAPARTLPERIAPQTRDLNDPAALKLRTALARHFGISNAIDAPLRRRSDQSPDALSWLTLGDMVSCLMDFLRRQQATLQLACEVQDKINALLGRSAPRRAFSASDIDIHIRLRGDTGERPPFLIDDLEQLFGIRITLDKDRLQIAGRKSAHGQPPAAQPHSRGMSPAETARESRA